MESFERELAVYLTAEGRAPFTEWFDSLRDIHGRVKIRARLDRVQLGNFGDRASVGDKSTQTQDILQAKRYWRDYKKRSGHGSSE